MSKLLNMLIVRLVPLKKLMGPDRRNLVYTEFSCQFWNSTSKNRKFTRDFSVNGILTRLHALSLSCTREFRLKRPIELEYWHWYSCTNFFAAIYEIFKKWEEEKTDSKSVLSVLSACWLAWHGLAWHGLKMRFSQGKDSKVGLLSFSSKSWGRRIEK